jgi:hypothetical protein
MLNEKYDKESALRRLLRIQDQNKYVYMTLYLLYIKKAKLQLQQIECKQATEEGKIKEAAAVATCNTGAICIDEARVSIFFLNFFLPVSQHTITHFMGRRFSAGHSICTG